MLLMSHCSRQNQRVMCSLVDTGRRFSPVWALGSSGAVGFFPVLKDRCFIRICEERDATSKRDVAKVKQRYLKAKRFVIIVRPRLGNDLNDSLMGIAT
ncbi:MAG: hypothetical protein WAM77_06330 [Xanthobacteraceae bacterium]